MKVKELVEKLKECNPEAEVSFAFEMDNPLNGSYIDEVIEICFRSDATKSDMVVLRG